MISWLERWWRQARERDLQRHFSTINPDSITDIDKYLRDQGLMS